MRLTVQDAARLLHVSEKSVYRWIKQGALPTYRVGNEYRFNAGELLAWATSRRLNVSVEEFHDASLSGAPMPGLADALQGGGIFYRLEGETPSAALASLVEHARLPEETDREYLRQILVAREELGSTAVGDGIAMPQLVYPTSLELPRPVLVLGYMEHPVPWKALDGQPVDVLLAVLCPHIRAHLHLSGRLDFALRRSSFVEALRRQGRREEILALLREFEEALPQ